MGHCGQALRPQRVLHVDHAATKFELQPQVHSSLTLLAQDGVHLVGAKLAAKPGDCFLNLGEYLGHCEAPKSLQVGL